MLSSPELLFSQVQFCIGKPIQITLKTTGSYKNENPVQNKLVTQYMTRLHLEKHPLNEKLISIVCRYYQFPKKGCRSVPHIQQ